MPAVPFFPSVGPVSDEELAARAESDHRRRLRRHRHPVPSLWRALVLLLLGALALSIVLV